MTSTSTPTPPSPTPPRRTSHLGRNLKIAAAVAALLTALGGVLAAVQPFSGDDKSSADKPASTSSGTGNVSNSGGDNNIGNTGSNNSGGNNCTASGTGSTAHCVQQLMADETLTDPQFRTEMAKVSTNQPPAAGPYQYVVVDTGKLGLKVRTGPELNDEQFGSAGNRSILWADCQLKSNFNADPSMKVGPVWLKIHWPHTTGTQWANSQPKDPAQGWVFAGYAIPAGHNGTIPTCSS
ncbi:hypothetical protein ACFTSF_37690 [Kribbella sp. NPDC056951]|uniref:hypothetical protein n=1 Tax=Kribbella sp. NPDC056951 TaxID=3345978 RepID=UPI0036322DC1